MRVAYSEYRLITLPNYNINTVQSALGFLITYSSTVPFLACRKYAVTYEL